MFIKQARAAAVAVLAVLVAGCPGGGGGGGGAGGGAAPAPTVTFSFPGGITCPSGSEVITSTAKVQGAGGTDPALVVTVCVTCNVPAPNTNIAGASVTGDLTGVTLPEGMARSFTGVTAANGCFTKRIPLRNLPLGVDASSLIGQTVNIAVDDGSTPPQPISSNPVTIQ
jgi:hypothetical protein